MTFILLWWRKNEGEKKTKRSENWSDDFVRFCGADLWNQSRGREGRTGGVDEGRGGKGEGGTEGGEGGREGGREGEEKTDNRMIHTSISIRPWVVELHVSE